MDEESISLSESEYALFKSLNEEKVEYIIVGLSAALLQGVPAVTQDIDLWVKELGSEKFVRALKKIGASYIPPGIVGANPPMIASKELRGIDLVTSCQGLGTVESELKGSLKVRIRELVVNVLPLARIVLSKESAGREKDLAVLPMLRAALAASDVK